MVPENMAPNSLQGKPHLLVQPVDVDILDEARGCQQQRKKQ
jgi:hypothetical protein